MSVGGAGRAGSSSSRSKNASTTSGATAKSAGASKQGAAPKGAARPASSKVQSAAPPKPAAGLLSKIGAALAAPFGAVTDFARNFQDMKAANVINADGYFHCKANYEAASRGYLGAVTASYLDAGREITDAIRGKSSFEAFSSDMAANRQGLHAGMGIGGKAQSAEEACGSLRPNGLSTKY